MRSFGFIMMFLENMNRCADLASKIQYSSFLFSHLKLGKIPYTCVHSRLLPVIKMLQSHLL